MTTVGSMMIRSLEKALPYLLLTIFLISFAMWAVFSEDSIGGADSLEHYRLSRYAFSNPEQFLDSWGKPLFTIVMAPFTQFGFIGARILNILLGLGAALLTFITARQLEYKHPVLAIPILVLGPIYAALMISGMTEIMFSFILILGIYLFFRERGNWSAIVISLLPFVRTEGFVIFPLFALGYLLNKQWKTIPLLLTGFVFFSIVGAFHHRDLLWVINKFPYTGEKGEIYGQGEFLHFIKSYKRIFGIPSFALILAGLLHLPVRSRAAKNTRTPFLNEALIGFMPFVTYFAAHSYVWWKGMGDSLGEIRVIAAVLPSAVLLALFGWNGLLNWLRPSVPVKRVLTVLLALSLVLVAARSQEIPVRRSPDRQLLKSAADWLAASEYANRKLHYFDPHWWFYLDKDPTDQEGMRSYSWGSPSLEDCVQPGELVLWDAHFGPNEGRVPLTRLTENSCFDLVRTFRPDSPFQTLGGYDYEIYVFMRGMDCE